MISKSTKCNLTLNLDNLKISTSDPSNVTNSEIIHQMRVSTRRLRIILENLNAIFPGKVRKIRFKLKKWGRLLGKKRNLDVFIEFIKMNLDFFKKLNQKREHLQTQLIFFLNSKRYSRLIKSLESFKMVLPTQDILKIALDCLQKLIRKVINIASSIDPRVGDITLHNLRIVMKKLRYSCEFFEPFLSQHIHSFDGFIEKTKKIQDILGDHQDAITGISLLIRYKNNFSLQEFLKIKKQYELKKMKARKLFFKIWKHYSVTLTLSEG